MNIELVKELGIKKVDDPKEIREIQSKIIEERYDGQKKIETDGTFHGNHLLNDGRVVQEQQLFGFFRYYFVFPSEEAFCNYYEESAHTYNPALKFN